MRTCSALIAAAAMCVTWTQAASAVVPLDIADQRAPTFEVYTSQDGLSDEVWNTLGFDRNGVVWAGSASTLAHFDGYRWTLAPLSEAQSLVRDMYTDDAGTLWALFDREGMAAYDGERWRLHPTTGGFIQRFSTLTQPNGQVQAWIGHELGFSMLRDGEWRLDPGNASLPPGSAITIAQTETLLGGPTQWMGSTALGLLFRQQRGDGSWAAWERYDAPEVSAMRLSDLQVTEQHGQEELWLISYGGGLARIRNDSLRLWRAHSSELPTEAIFSARATYTASGERLLWLASRAGLLRMRGDEISVFDRRHGLPSDAVRGISVTRSADGIDVLWLATEGGIARAVLSESQWQTVTLAGARENGIFGLMLDPDGRGGERLWVGTSKEGLALLHLGQWRNFKFAHDALPSIGMRGMWRLPRTSQEPWRLLSLENGKLLQINDDLSFSPVQVPWKQGLGSGAIDAASRLHDGDREFWFGTQYAGTYRFRDGRWRHFGVSDSVRPWAVRKFLEQIDQQGNSQLWAATSHGLARLDGEQWTLLGEQLGLPEDGLRGLALIKAGDREVLWLGSDRHAVIRVEVTDPTSPILVADGAVPPPPGPTVHSVLSDSKQRIYICTNNGVQQLTPDGTGGYSERVYRRKDGMVHDECNTSSQFVDSHDRYWVGTLGGLSLFDPSIEVQALSTVPKPLLVTEFRVDSTPYEPPTEGTLLLPPGSREIRLAYSVLSNLREHESSYRTQLIGYEAELGDWTREYQRSYTGLWPGDYEFLLLARDYAGTPSAERRLRFRIEPYWWQRAQTLWLLVLLTVAIVALAVLVYNRSLRLRQRKLKRLVAERTADLRSANERLTELSYADPLTGIANRRRLMEAIKTALERAQALARPIGLIVIDVDHFKNYNDQHGHLAGDAALRGIAKALQSATREQDMVARFGGEEFACLMTDADAETVARIAERMRALVEALPPRALGNDTQTITLSAGTLSRIPNSNQSASSLLGEADAAMYRAKRDGRNCVRSAD